MSSNASSSRPVHPCVLSIGAAARGVEFSAWARNLLTLTPLSSSCNDNNDNNGPYLVTAAASTIRIYRWSAAAGRLRLVDSINVAGSLTFLECLPSPSPTTQPDVLVMGLAGEARLSVVQYQPAQHLLETIALLDLTAWQGNSLATVQDAQYCLQTAPTPGAKEATLVALLEGGATVALVTLLWKSRGGWRVVTSHTATAGSANQNQRHQPYQLPLHELATSLPTARPSEGTATTTAAPAGATASATTTAAGAAHAATRRFVATGWGDILSIACLPGDRVDCVVALLHVPTGVVTSGRLARQGGTRPPPCYLTAVAVHAWHGRAAWLWSVALPTDAYAIQAIPASTDHDSKSNSSNSSSISHAHPTACVVLGVNSISVIHPAGRLLQCVATNGWAHTTCPLGLSQVPNPGLPLSLSLDGAVWTWLPPTAGGGSQRAALVLLRSGEVYVWQPVAAASTNANGAASDTPRFTLLPTGHVLPNLGQVAHVSTVWPLSLTHVVQQQQKVLLPGCFDKPMLDGLLDDGKLSATVAGLILIGSRLGDSHLVALGCEGQPTKDEAWSVWNIVPNDQDSVKEKEAIVKGEAPLVKQEDNSAATLTAYEAMLQREEEALYTEPDVVPGATSNGPLAKKPKSQQPDLPWTVLKAMTILDTLVHLGPLGPSHTGPIAATPPFMRVPVDATVPNSDDVVTSAPARVFPVGFGSSGGLAWAALPGRDDRMIVSEKDCLNVECIFGLPTLSMVLLGMIPDATTGEGKPLRLLHATPDSLTEVDLEEQAPDCAHLFQGKLLQAGEFRTTGYFAVLVQHDPGADTFACIMKIHDGRITLIKHVSLPVDAVLCQVAPFVAHYDYISTVFVWQSGEATLVQLDIQGNLSTVHFANDAPVEAMKIDDEQNEDEDEEDRALRDFYAQKDIVAADFFTAPRGLFDVPAKPVANGAVTPVDGSTSPRDGISSDMDEDDMELYGMAPPVESSVSLTASPEPPTTEQACFLALCRQSGELEIHLVSDKEVSSSLVWSCQGLSQGFATLGSSVAPDSFAKSHKVQVSELRFFSCGLTLSKKTAALSGSSLRSFCLAVETSAGDVFVYQVGKDTVDGVLFIRQPLALVVRSSQEQANHRKKLSRKGIIAKDADTVKSPFVHSTLFPFRDLSGQDGLFVSTPRPFWLVAERGYPSVVYHRARHAAPAGGKPKIMNGFCSIGEGRFMTLHERVGRVGSQRLTLFDGISKVFQSQGVLAGGLCIERQILGVTVRRVEFIDDPDISTGDRPLYAVLVSREIEVDQSHLNDDGLLPEEREEAKKEKEKAKTQRQVEADLGGFDFEHEWVEEITREDVFQVDQDLGGAPPILKQAYSLWIVDAANKWQIVDAYDLDEYEHGVTLSIMSLSNFKEEPGKGSGNEEEGVPEDLDLTLFIMVGTGTVDHNGEDVTGKGRALLFTLLRRGALGVSLQLASEKEIFHGAVTTLDCLSVEGKNRLILGAGADVNVEQWGNGKLTQVGFFRATMHIADIRIFKNFLLLSDAYDSLHMLIYRESDKSLTLLAKEYEPVAVYATGVMSRAQSMSFLLHDDRMNLQFLQYAPGEAAARGGNKLVCRADFHLGTQTIGFGSHFCRNSLLIHSATPTSTLAALQQQDSYTGRADDDQRIAANFGTTDGTLGAVVPLSEPVYWRLTALQSVLANALESDGGLSPRAWRLYRRSPRRGGCRSNERKKSVIDGDLVRRYADLPTRTQEDLASAVGSTVGLILDNLLELECGSLVL